MADINCSDVRLDDCERLVSQGDSSHSTASASGPSISLKNWPNVSFVVLPATRQVKTSSHLVVWSTPRLSHREAATPGSGTASVRRIASQSLIGVDVDDNALVRVLVLDDDPGTPQLIENALWTWPHRIAMAGCAADAITMCRHLEPAALIVSLDFAADRSQTVIAALRNELPNTVIIAFAASADAPNRGTLLDLGANAVLTREELQRPTLHSLLMRLRQEPVNGVVPVTRTDAPLGLPWRESKIVGSVICDISGTVKAANACLAVWLGYPQASSLLGKCIWRDLLSSPADWSAWKTVAGDMTAIVQCSAAVRARNKQLLWMEIEVFAAPNSPTEIQAVFVDKSELAQLTGRAMSN